LDLIITEDNFDDTKLSRLSVADVRKLSEPNIV